MRVALAWRIPEHVILETWTQMELLNAHRTLDFEEFLKTPAPEE